MANRSLTELVVFFEKKLKKERKMSAAAVFFFFMTKDPDQTGQSPPPSHGPNRGEACLPTSREHPWCLPPSLPSDRQAIGRHPCPIHVDPWHGFHPNPDWSESKSLIRFQGVDKTTQSTFSPRWTGPQTVGAMSWTPRGLLRSRGIDKTRSSRWSRGCASPPTAMSYNRSEQPGVSWTPRLGVSFEFVVSPFFDGTIVFVSPRFPLDAWRDIVDKPPSFVRFGSFVLISPGFVRDGLHCSVVRPRQFWLDSFPGVVF